MNSWTTFGLYVVYLQISCLNLLNNISSVIKYVIVSYNNNDGNYSCVINNTVNMIIIQFTLYVFFSPI